MIVRRFLAWSQMVPPGQRAEGVSALALGYLYSQMAPEIRREAEAALTAVLEDSSPLVRRALAEAFASAVDAPHHCVFALANDQPEIATLVLERSPVLSDQDLIDCAAAGQGAAQIAIARRPKLSSMVRAERLRRDASERAIIDIALAEARDESPDDALEMARHLRAAGRLTPALMLRALLSGDRSLFEAALAELAGQPLARAAGFVRFHQGSGFQALFDRARMPPSLLPVFQAALMAQDEGGELSSGQVARLSRELIRHVLRACEALEDPDLAQVMALLRRFDAESAQEEARALTRRICEVQKGPIALPNPGSRPLLMADSEAS